jgi:hypothetical protein
LESSLGRGRGVGAMVRDSAALEEFCVPLAAGRLVGWSDVGKVIFREGQPRQGWRLEGKRLGRRVPLSRRVSFRHRALFHTVDRFSSFAIENEQERIFCDDRDGGNFLTVLDHVK